MNKTLCPVLVLEWQMCDVRHAYPGVQASRAKSNTAFVAVFAAAVADPVSQFV